MKPSKWIYGNASVTQRGVMRCHICGNSIFKGFHHEMGVMSGDYRCKEVYNEGRKCRQGWRDWQHKECMSDEWNPPEDYNIAPSVKEGAG